MAKMTCSDMYCTQCGKKNIPVQRNAGREREPGHLKRMFCVFCGKEVNMVEVRDFGVGYTLEDFRFEYENNNFDINGLRLYSLTDLHRLVRDREKEREKNEKDN